MLAYGILTYPLTIRQTRAALGCLCLGCLVIESHGKPQEATEETEETERPIRGVRAGFRCLNLGCPGFGSHGKLREKTEETEETEKTDP